MDGPNQSFNVLQNTAFEENRAGEPLKWVGFAMLLSGILLCSIEITNSSYIELYTQFINLNFQIITFLGGFLTVIGAFLFYMGKNIFDYSCKEESEREASNGLREEDSEFQHKKPQKTRRPAARQMRSQIVVQTIAGIWDYLKNLTGVLWICLVIICLIAAIYGYHVKIAVIGFEFTL